MLKVLLAPLLPEESLLRAPRRRIPQRLGACGCGRGLGDERLPFRAPVAAGGISRPRTMSRCAWCAAKNYCAAGRPPICAARPSCPCAGSFRSRASASCRRHSTAYNAQPNVKTRTGAARLSRALRRSRISGIRLRARCSAVLLSRKPGPGESSAGWDFRPRAPNKGRTFMCAFPLSGSRSSAPQSSAIGVPVADILQVWLDVELPSGPRRGAGRGDPPPRPCADLRGETVMAGPSDVEYFARLVEHPGSVARSGRHHRRLGTPPLPPAPSRATARLRASRNLRHRHRCPARSAGTGEQIRTRLLERGFREELMGDMQPPAAHYRVESGDNSFYAEFLTPLEGSEVKRGGRRDVTHCLRRLCPEAPPSRTVARELPGR